MEFCVTVVFLLFIFFKEGKLERMEFAGILYALEFSVKTSLRLSLSYDKYLGHLCVAFSSVC